MAKTCFLYLLICLCVAGHSQSYFSRVRTALANGDARNSFAILDSCNSKNYCKDSVLFYRGLLHLKLNNIKEAEKNCSSLLKSYPGFYEAHYLDGLIYFENENYGKSADAFSKVLQKYPRHLKALFDRALALGMLENYLYAIDDLNRCIIIDSNYVQAYYSRAYWQEFLQNFSEAGKDYETCIRLDPKNYDAYFGLAYVHQIQKEPAKACEVINRAIANGSQIAEDLKEAYCR